MVWLFDPVEWTNQGIYDSKSFYEAPRETFEFTVSTFQVSNLRCF